MTARSKNTQKGRLRLSLVLRAPSAPGRGWNQGQRPAPGHVSGQPPGSANNCCIYREIQSRPIQGKLSLTCGEGVPRPTPAFGWVQAPLPISPPRRDLKPN